MSRIISAALSAFPPSLAPTLANILHEQPSPCSAALTAALSSISGVLFTSSAESKHVPTLLKIINEGGFDADALARLKSMDVTRHSAELLASGKELSQALLGSEAERLSGALAAITRLQPESARALLGAASVFFFAAVGQAAPLRPLTLAAAQALLSEEAKAPRLSSPSAAPKAAPSTPVIGSAARTPLAQPFTSPSLNELPLKGSGARTEATSTSRTLLSPSTMVAGLALGLIGVASYAYVTSTKAGEDLLAASYARNNPTELSSSQLTGSQPTGAQAPLSEEPTNSKSAPAPLSEAPVAETNSLIASAEPALAGTAEKAAAQEALAPQGSQEPDTAALALALSNTNDLGGIASAPIESSPGELRAALNPESLEASAKPAENQIENAAETAQEAPPAALNSEPSVKETPQETSDNRLRTSFEQLLASPEKQVVSPSSFALEDIRFVPGRPELQSAISADLRETTALLLKHPRSRIQIKVFSENTGPERARVGLAQLRAERLKRELIKLGLSASRIDTKAELPPTGSTEAEAGSFLTELALVRK